jgi:hypothetical protein
MVRFAVAVLVALTLACGVGGAHATAVLPHQNVRGSNHGWMVAHANPKHAWLYTASGVQNAVAIYDLDGFGTPQIGEITEGLIAANGMAVDNKGTLYVANWNGGHPGGDVTIYSTGSISPSLTLSQGLTVPLDVAVDTNGDVYVSNRSPDSIVVYAQGQTTPKLTITSGLIVAPSQVQFDSNRNLFIGEAAGIIEVPFGSQQPMALNLEGLVKPSGVAFDPITGDMFVSDLGRNHVYVYAPGSSTQSRRLQPAMGACLLASGPVKNTAYVFVPQCSFNGTIWVFKHRANKPKTVLTLNGAGGAASVALKPAGVP